MDFLKTYNKGSLIFGRIYVMFTVADGFRFSSCRVVISFAFADFGEQ